MRSTLDDSLTVLRDPGRWPQAICRGTLKLSTSHWARLHAEIVFADAPPAWRAACKQWAECWPLPVGRHALQATLDEDSELREWLSEDAAWALQASLPFSQDEYAALVLWAPLDPEHRPGDRLTAFVLADPQDLDAGLGELGWTSRGYTNIPDDMKRFVTGAKQFVTQFRGQPLSRAALAGRKPGRRSRTYRQVQNAFWRLRNRREPWERDPSQGDVAQEIATSVDTVGRLCRGHERETGISAWPPPPYRPPIE